MKSSLTWYGALFASGALVVTAFACSSSSTPSSTPTTRQGATAGVFLSGTYNAVTAGPIAQITFYMGDHYQLVDGTCANALLGATTGGTTPSSMATCNELGTYAVDAAGTKLTLSPVSGTPRVLPFHSVLAGESYGVESQSVRSGDLHTLGSGGGYYGADGSAGDSGSYYSAGGSAGDSGGYYSAGGSAGDSGGYYGADAATGDSGGYYEADGSVGDSGGYYGADGSLGDSGGYYGADGSLGDSGGYYGADGSVGDSGGYYGADAGADDDGGSDASADDAGGEGDGGDDASADDAGGDASAGEADGGEDASAPQRTAASCPGGTPAQGGAPLTRAFTAGSQTLVGGGAPSGTPDPTQSGQWSCTGSFDQAASNAYYLTTFGCSSSSPAFQDSADNCCGAGAPVAAAAGLCGSLKPASNCSNSCANSNSCNSWRSQQSGSTAASFQCEEKVNYYSTGAVAYGLGTRLCLSTGAGKGLVVFVYDDGPSCTIERRVNAHVLDVSPPTAQYLFGESQISAPERKAVFVTQVGASTPLGPNDGCASAAADAGSDAGASPTSSSGDAGASPTSSSGGASDGGCASSTPCAGDSDCNPGGPLGLVCSSGACQPGCHTSAQCVGGTSCVSGSCQGTGAGRSCSNDGACNPGGNGAGMICSGGACVSGCRASWQCPGGTTCKSGQCG
jgi:hypothetical protein